PSRRSICGAGPAGRELPAPKWPVKEPNMTEGANPALAYDNDEGASDFMDNPAARLALSEAVRMAEAVIFASAEPVSDRQLAARLPEGVDVAAVTADLRELYANRGINLVRVGDA